MDRALDDELVGRGARGGDLPRWLARRSQAIARSGFA